MGRLSRRAYEALPSEDRVGGKERYEKLFSSAQCNPGLRAPGARGCSRIGPR